MSYAPEGSCPNPDCICTKPGRICEEFMPYRSAYCARCGWERLDHPHAPLIHNGGKP